MMTLHAAKGLEFNTIIIAGLEEGLLPSNRSLNDFDALEEERRLFYVGVTRAMERLILTRAMYRNTYGQVSDQDISRFVTEIPDNLLHHFDATKVHPAKVKTLMAEWIGGDALKTLEDSRSITTFGDVPNYAKRNSLTPEINSSANKKQPPRKTIRPQKTFIPPRVFKPAGPKSPWKRNQVVLHKAFGPGMVKKIEKAPADDFYLTILFKNGEKRILSTFIRTI